MVDASSTDVRQQPLIPFGFVFWKSGTAPLALRSSCALPPLSWTCLSYKRHCSAGPASPIGAIAQLDLPVL